MQIFKNKTAAGDSDIIELPSPFGSRFASQLFTVFAWGTWGGATMTFLLSPDGDNWFTIPDISFTADDLSNLTYRARYLKGNIAGGVAMSLNAVLR